MVLSPADVTDSTMNVSGVVQTADGAGVAGLMVSLYLNDVYQAATLTNADGTFSYALARPDPGTYTVGAVWAGDSQYLAAADRVDVTIAAPAKAATALTLSLNPKSANPSTTVAITGKLVSGTTPIGSAMVTLSADYGDVDNIVATGADGTFAAMMSFPDAPDFPASFTVTASFAGDEVYEGSTITATGAITAPATPTPSLTPTPTPTASALAPVPNDSSTPVDAATSNGVFLQTVDARWATVRMVFMVVALVGLGAVIILGIISHDHKKLARDERRGFGTDFGQEH